jgi:hypothetical protein
MSGIDELKKTEPYQGRVGRRGFLSGIAGLTAYSLRAQPPAIPIIDTHIHLFDTSRPQGVPYPSKDNVKLYQPALPERYRKIAQPFGVVGAIEIEASPWIEDNLWVLEVAAKDTTMVGTVGNLEPGKPEFPEQMFGPIVEAAAVHSGRASALLSQYRRPQERCSEVVQGLTGTEERVTPRRSFG